MKKIIRSMVLAGVVMGTSGVAMAAVSGGAPKPLSPNFVHIVLSWFGY